MTITKKTASTKPTKASGKARPNKTGAPTKTIDLVKLRECGRLGMSLEQAAAAQGIHRDTLQYKRFGDVEIKNAWDEGHAEGVEAMTTALMNRATKDKSDAAIIFWLKARAGWSDRQVIEIGNKDDKPLQIEVSDVRSKVLGRLLPTKKDE